MKRKLLLLLLCITTLTLSACGKKETPVMSNSVTTEVETEPISENETVTETITNTTEEITEATTETDTNIEVDINGVGGTVEEGDYDEELHATPETDDVADQNEVVNTENGMTAQETLDKFEELMGGFDDEFGSDVGGGISQEVLDNATVAPDYANDPW